MKRRHKIKNIEPPIDGIQTKFLVGSNGAGTITSNHYYPSIDKRIPGQLDYNRKIVNYKKRDQKQRQKRLRSASKGFQNNWGQLNT
jgi:hypothetical protein